MTKNWGLSTNLLTFTRTHHGKISGVNVISYLICSFFREAMVKWGEKRNKKYTKTKEIRMKLKLIALALILTAFSISQGQSQGDPFHFHSAICNAVQNLINQKTLSPTLASCCKKACRNNQNLAPCVKGIVGPNQINHYRLDSAILNLCTNSYTNQGQCDICCAFYTTSVLHDCNGCRDYRNTPSCF